jgi:hypothetical protein
MIPQSISIHHFPASTGVYIGSPSLALLPNGLYVASHDDFGPGSSADRTSLYESRDRGAHWEPIGVVTGQYWSNLFVHRGELFLLGTTREYGDVAIRRSRDGGHSWTKPQDSRTGLLLTGGQYHCAPVPVLQHGGRLWRAFERRQPARGWAENFQALVLSVPEDADLLDARAWRASEPLAHDPAWGIYGWLEGNMVTAPGGELVDLLRTDCRGTEQAAWVTVNSDGSRLHFAPETGLTTLPGGCKKFTIRHDPLSRLYWGITNPTAELTGEDIPGSVRNTLALIASPDLRSWQQRRILHYHPDRLRHGYQYVDWQFDGADIAAVVRVADDDAESGAHNYHDANFLTFLRVSRFRED